MEIHYLLNLSFLVLQLHSGGQRFSLDNPGAVHLAWLGSRVRFGLRVLSLVIAGTQIQQLSPCAAAWAQDNTDYEWAAQQTLSELQQVFSPADFPEDLQIRTIDSAMAQYEKSTILVGRFPEKKSSTDFWRLWRAALTHELGHAVFQTKLRALRTQCLFKQQNVKPWADFSIDVCQVIFRPYEELFADFLVVHFSNDVSLVSKTYEFFWASSSSSVQAGYRDFSPQNVAPEWEPNTDEIPASFGNEILDQVLRWPEPHIHLAQSRRLLGQDHYLRQSPLLFLEVIALELTRHTQMLPDLPNPLTLNERLMYGVQQLTRTNN